MIYLILSEDEEFSDMNVYLRVNLNGKVKSFYIVRYTENKEDAENYCKHGGRVHGGQTPRFSFMPIKKIGEK